MIVVDGGMQQDSRAKKFSSSTVSGSGATTSMQRTHRVDQSAFE
jgi:hypothetical protein